MSITRVFKRSLLVFIVPVIAIIATACNPNDPVQLQAWYDLNPAQGENVTPETMNEPQRNVVNYLQEQQRAWIEAHARAERQSANSGNCYTEMRKVFPASMHGWAERVIHRESRGNPAAANPRSTARGCFQLLSSLHADKYAAVGCHVSQWADARCNVRAAHHLYKLAGTSPWNF